MKKRKYIVDRSGNRVRTFDGVMIFVGMTIYDIHENRVIARRACGWDRDQYHTIAYGGFRCNSQDIFFNKVAAYRALKKRLEERSFELVCKLTSVNTALMAANKKLNELQR